VLCIRREENLRDVLVHYVESSCGSTTVRWYIRGKLNSALLDVKGPPVVHAKVRMKTSSTEVQRSTSEENPHSSDRGSRFARATSVMCRRGLTIFVLIARGQVHQ
jgi:hypothetical protein